MKGKAKTDFSKEMAALRKQQAAAKKEWEKVKKATAANWEKAKARMEAAVRHAENTYDKVAARLKEHTN